MIMMASSIEMGNDLVTHFDERNCAYLLTQVNRTILHQLYAQIIKSPS